MKAPPLTASLVITNAGGPKAFAEAIGKNQITVRVWKCRGFFPRMAWPDIQAAFPELTTEKLLEIEKASIRT
jgi:hypothetical protein